VLVREDQEKFSIRLPRSKRTVQCSLMRFLAEVCKLDVHQNKKDSQSLVSLLSLSGPTWGLNILIKQLKFNHLHNTVYKSSVQNKKERGFGCKIQYNI